MADGGGDGGGGKRLLHKKREIKPASDDEKLLLPYLLSVAHTCSHSFSYAVRCASSEPPRYRHAR